MTDSTAEAVTNLVDRHPFMSWLGAEVLEAGDGTAVVMIPAADKLRNPDMANDQTMHGGVIASLVDNATSLAFRTTFEDPETAQLTTTNLDVNYLRPATDDVTATATVRRAGRTMGVADVDVTAEHAGETKLVAIGRATYRLFREG
ncbi:MAG: PaaI family thioesterase [Salinirussus sp.]